MVERPVPQQELRCSECEQQEGKFNTRGHELSPRPALEKRLDLRSNVRKHLVEVVQCSDTAVQ